MKQEIIENLNQCVPTKLKETMEDEASEVLTKAKMKFVKQAVQEGVKYKNSSHIALDLVTVPCKLRLLNNTQLADDYLNHMNSSHGIDMNCLRSRFAMESNCKTSRIPS